MSDNTQIEWTDATWNVVTGCSVISPGCTNCYAMRLAGTRMKNEPSRMGLTVETKAGPVWNGQVRFNDYWLDQPIRWKRPRRIFVAAHGDLFHEGVIDAQLDQIVCVMAIASQHTFQVLTKRADRMRDYFHALQPVFEERMWATGLLEFSNELAWPLPNVWLGVSAEDQVRANERISPLLDTPAAVRWLSAEPLLGPIDVNLPFEKSCDCLDDAPTINVLSGDVYCAGCCEGGEPTTAPTLDWVVVGGESGPSARPMHPDWARQIRDECEAAKVPFVFKQWGSWGACSHLDIDGLYDRIYHPAPIRHPEATRRPRVPITVLHNDGERFDRIRDLNAFASGKGAMTMFQLGKATTGRHLDGQLHDGYPV